MMHRQHRRWLLRIKLIFLKKFDSSRKQVSSQGQSTRRCIGWKLVIQTHSVARKIRHEQGNGEQGRRWTSRRFEEGYHFIMLKKSVMERLLKDDEPQKLPSPLPSYFSYISPIVDAEPPRICFDFNQEVILDEIILPRKLGGEGKLR